MDRCHKVSKKKGHRFSHLMRTAVHRDLGGSIEATLSRSFKTGTQLIREW